MKKFLSIMLTVVLCMSMFMGVAQARIGDKIGVALNTDIVAYINHYALPSFAVNGQSVIVAEDLRNFGFNVDWNEYARTLRIYRNANNYVNPLNVAKTGARGSHFADILQTDIKVYANGKQITSYAMNGYTMIPIEELGMFGSVIWSDSERAIKLWVEDGLQISPQKQVVKTTGQTVNITPDLQRKINVFLSNFSETYIYSYNQNYINWEEMISFAFIHNLINGNNKIGYTSYEMYISASDANTTLNKYFGVTAPLRSVGMWTYRNNRFYTAAASGETYDYYSVANSMVQNSDGTYTVTFDTYYAGYDGIANGYYSFTPAEARWSGHEYVRSGTAVIREKTYNGQKTWEMISLS